MAGSARLLERLASRWRRRPRVSVVVTVTDDNAFFLDECVGSVLDQRRGADEVVLVVTGRDHLTRTGADAQVRTSDRVRAVRHEIGSARRIGAEESGGELLLFLDAGDRLRPNALAGLSAALTASGAPLAVGGQGSTETRADLTSHPEVLATPALAERMFRREFLLGLDLPEEAVLDRWLPAVVAHRAAPTFATVGEPAHQDLERGTGVAFGGMPVLAPRAPAFAASAAEQLRALSADGFSEAASVLRATLLAELSRFLDDAERCSGDEWRALAELARWLLGSGDPPAAVLARAKVLLAAEGRRDELAELCADRWWGDGERFPTEVGDGRLLAVLPVPLAEDARVLGPQESPVEAVLRRACWQDGHLEVELFAHVRGLARDRDRTRADLALVGEAGAREPVETSWARDPEAKLFRPDPHHDHSDGVLRARLPVAALAPGRWTLSLTLETGGVTRSGVVGQAERRGSAAVLPERGGTRLTFPDGVPTIVVGADLPPVTAEPPGATAVEDVRIEGGTLLVTTSGLRPDEVAVTGEHGTARGTALRASGDRVVTEVPLEHDPWGRGTTPLPVGTYRIGLPMAPRLAARTPEVQPSSAYRLRLHRALNGEVLLLLGPPLRDEEVGEHGQRALQRWYASDEHRVDPGLVYFQSYLGASATDSPLAIHRALREARPDLRTVWAVADPSAQTPEGAERCQVRSREWYAALATAGHLVTNIDLDRWFRKRPGQRVVQTYHGYPAKAMGLLAWRSKGLTPLRFRHRLGATRDVWDVVMCAHPSMAVHFREQFDYDGAVFGDGYPRHDALVGAGGSALRELTRRRLGIGDDETVVLYAPTWRDDLASNHRVAPMVTAFDVEAAAAALGDGHVILVRGHRYHRGRAGVSAARVVDVTAHPEIDELVLACDVAVLDYSSLRFDLLVVGTPMVFLVPDLERYTSAVRGFLYDFAPSAPGPLVATTDEVVAELRDLPGLVTRHASAYAAARDRFLGTPDGHAADRAVAALFPAADRGAV